MEVAEIEPSSGSSFSMSVSLLAVTELDTTSMPADLFSGASIELQQTVAESEPMPEYGAEPVGVKESPSV